jgi:hypothetical protein
MMKSAFCQIWASVLLLAALFTNFQEASDTAFRTVCTKSKLFTVQNIIVWSVPSVGGAFFYESGLAIDADGAPRAYHPNDRLGLDSLANAGQTRKAAWREVMRGAFRLCSSDTAHTSNTSRHFLQIASVEHPVPVISLRRLTPIEGESSNLE